MEMNIDYLFCGPSARRALCPVGEGMLQRAGVSVRCVWRDGREGWEEKSCRKLLFHALSLVPASWALMSPDPALSESILIL